MTTTLCPNCCTTLQIPEAALGKRVKCTQCNHIFDAQSLQANLASALPPPLPKNGDSTATCPKCGTLLQLPAGWSGKQVKCLKCNTIFDVSSTPKNDVPSTPKNDVRSTPKNDVPSAPKNEVRSAPKNEVRPAPKNEVRTAPKNVSTTRTMQPQNTIRKAYATRSGPAPKTKRRMHWGWVVASLAALLLPILSASALTVWRKSGSLWNAPKPNANRSSTYAGIEIGSNGPRYCLVEFLPVEKGGDNFRVLANEQTTARLTNGIEKTGEFDPREFGKAMSAVQTFYNRLVTERQVPPEQIVIVSSETLLDSIRQRQDIDEQEKERLIHRDRDSLAAAVKKATGQTMEFVKRAKLAEYQVRAVVRKSDLKDAVFLDIGRSSTRGAYCDAANVFQAAEAPGIKEFEDRVKDGLDEDGNFAERAAKVAEKHLCEPIRRGLGKDPEFAARNKVYLAGGISWVMANCQHPGNDNDYVHLTAADIKEFTEDKVRKRPDLLMKIRPDAGLPPERQDWLKGEYARMRSAFKSPERLVAGAEILLAISSELQFAGRDIWFYRHSDFAWVASYIEETRRHRK